MTKPKNIKRTFDESVELKKNAMLSRRPELFYEWDFEKNDELGLDIYRVTYGSGKKAWWICPDCKSEYDMEIQKRSEKNRKMNCPYCRGYRVNHTNSLASLRPDIASQWHPTKNEELTPHNVTCGRVVKVWWLGECGHEWESTIISRTREESSGCPYCSYNPKLLKGHNDMWTTNPELAKLLLNPEDGYKYTQSSNKKVDWKCNICENIINNKSINNANKRGVPCPICSDGISFPEKFVYNMLNTEDISFNYNCKFNWSENRFYDFHLLDYNCVVEVHGKQHYKESFRSIKGARTLKEEQENDRLKEQLAKENGIDRYIVIDARYSTLEWIKKSILNSELRDIIDLSEVDWFEIERLATKSMVKEACDLWMSGIRNSLEISKILKVSRGTVIIYLKRGAEIGWCDYTPYDSHRATSKEQ